MEIRRTNGRPWRQSTPSFGVKYVKRSQVEAGLQLPSVAVSVSATASLSAYYNLGGLFAVLFDARARPTNYYDCCLLCLQLPANAFCRDSQGGAPSCMANASACADPDAERVVNITMCDSQSDSGSGSLPRQYRDSSVCLDSRSAAAMEVELTNSGGGPASAPELGDGTYNTIDIGDVPWTLKEENAHCSNGEWRDMDETFEECIAAANTGNYRYVAYRVDDWNCRLSRSCNLINQDNIGARNIYESDNWSDADGTGVNAFDAVDTTLIVGGAARAPCHVAVALTVLVSFLKAGFN